jgi:hypothetical protein
VQLIAPESIMPCSALGERNMDDEERFIVQSNIERYRGLLQQPLDAITRKTVEALLADAKLEMAQDDRAVC